MGQTPEPATQSQADCDRERLGRIGPDAERARRRYGSLPLRKFRDLPDIVRSFGRYRWLVSEYGKTTWKLTVSGAIVRRSRGEAEAEGFRATWESQADHAYRELTNLGCALAIGVGFWTLDHLHTASRPDAPVSERDYSRDKVLHATRNFHEELRRFRQSLRRGGEDLDLTALFEAHASVVPAAASAVKAFECRARQLARTAGLEQVLRELPFVLSGVIEKLARSVLCAAYVAEAPRRTRMVENWDSVPDLTDAAVETIDREAEEDDLRRRVRSELTERQQSALMGYWEALSQGYTRSGKLRQSLRQYWRANYDRKRRMLHRIRGDHPDLVSDVEQLARRRLIHS